MPTLLLPTVLACARHDIPVAPADYAARLESDDPNERSLAVSEILGMQYVPPEAIPPLLKLLRDDDRNQRLMAARALAELRQEGLPYVRQLRAARKTERDVQVRTAIFEALVRIQNPEHGGLPP